MSEPFVFEFPDGSKASFPVFTVKEYEALQGRIAASLKKSNRLLAQERNLGPMDEVRFLKESDPKSIGPYDVETFINDDREARKILLQSIVAGGVTPDGAESVVAKITVMERATLVKHVVGLINLSPMPEEDRLASERMKAFVRLKTGRENVEGMTMREFYDAIAALQEPEDNSPAGWFAANTQSGSAKQVLAAAG